MFTENSKFNSAKERILVEAERVASRYLLAKYGMGKLSKESHVDLSSKEGSANSTFLFNGKVRCFATVETSKGFHDVGLDLSVSDNSIDVESETTLADKVENALNRASEYAGTTDEVIRASLEDFKLADNGDYLEVSHPAFMDASLGVVGKNEFASSKSKEALLKSIVQDSISRTASYIYKVEFTGTFVEPTIVKKAEIVLETPVEPVVKNASQFVAPVEIESEEESPRGRMPDFLSQQRQANAQKIASLKDRLLEVVANESKIHLYKSGYDAKIQEVDGSNLSYVDSEGLTGQVDVTSFVDVGGNTKVVSMPVSVKASVITLPKKSLVSELVANALDIDQRISEEITKSAILKISEIDEAEQWKRAEVDAILNGSMEKTASDSTNEMFMGETDVLTIQKHLLPHHEDLKLHDRISDGANQWEIVNMEAQQNDKNANSSSLWTLKKCAPPEFSNKEPKVIMEL